MAVKNLLHKSKLEEFKAWLEKNYGLIIEPCKGSFEVLRWSKGDKYGGPMPIIYQSKSNEHYSCNEASIAYVKKFIKEKK